MTERRRWTEEDILAAIRSRKEQGLPLNSRAVRLDDTPLFQAALRAYGTWEEVLRVSGIDPSAVRLRSRPQRWPEERIAYVLKEIVEQGYSLSPAQMKKYWPSLYHAGCNKYGSWRETLRAFSYDPDQHVRSYTRQEKGEGK